MKDSTLAIRFLETLEVPQGPKAGRKLKLAPFQKRFVRGALDKSVNTGVLSVGRGAGKSALSAGLALGSLLGEWDDQPSREVLIAARTRDQARIAWDFAAQFAMGLPEDIQERLTFRRSPRLEIEFEDERGSHFLRAIAAEGRNWS
jgi:phage terminase large subunit-like protein